MSQHHPSLYVVTHNGLSLGVCAHSPCGWKFISHLSAHNGSRRFWPSPEDAVPRWARGYKPTLMTGERFRALRNGGAA